MKELKQNEEKNATIELESELNRLHEEENPSRESVGRMREIKTELMKINQNIEKGKQIQSREDIIANETGSRFFPIGEKRRQEKKEITELERADGKTI